MFFFGMIFENLLCVFNILRFYGVEVDGSEVCLIDLKVFEVFVKFNILIDERNS